MKLAVIDIGSNTIKMTAYAVGTLPSEIYSKTVHAKLSSHLTDGALSQKGIKTLSSAVNDLKRTARAIGCKKQNVFAFATACVRGATNREHVLRAAEKSTKIKISLLSGEQEAEICLLGALAAKGCPDSGVLADLGGGSCELISFENSAELEKVSLDIGALAMHKKFASGGQIKPSERILLSEYLKEQLKEGAKNIKIPLGGSFVVTGGSARATLKMLSAIDGRARKLPCTVTLGEAEELCERISSGELAELCEKTVKERAKTLVPGATVFIKVAEKLGAASFTVIGGGARDGFARLIISDRGK